MERRFQVFISSTYTDLVDARREVSDALLKCDCFPAGMELFPAADAEQFEFIKEVIDKSDYYIVVSAGKYGSIHPELNRSYTELEYDFAVEKGKPIIRLLHKDPFALLAGNLIEGTDAGRAALAAFREKLTSGNLVGYWQSPKELGQQVILGLIDAKKRKPAIGWVRADKIASEEAVLSIEKLKTKVAELEGMIIAQSSELDLQKIFSRKSVVELNLYEYVRDYTFDDFDGVNLSGRIFQKTVRLLRMSAGDYAERLLIGFLFTDDSDTVRTHAGAILDSETDIVKEVAILEDDVALENIFMRLEETGIIRRSREREFLDFLGNKSAYLAKNRWNLSDMARQFAVRRAVTGKYMYLSEVDVENSDG